MVYVMSICYPNTPDIKFDTTYYLNEHMRKCWDLFKERGLRSFEVIKYESDDRGTKPLYLIGTTLVWSSAEALWTGFGDPEAQALLEDVPNFTNVQPIMFAGNVIGTST